MGHYAKVVDNIVVNVIVADSDFFESFVDGSPGNWIETSYNTHGGVHYDENGNPSSDQSKALRKNFAGVGYFYNPVIDAFIPPKPSEDAILDQDSCLWVKAQF